MPIRSLLRTCQRLCGIWGRVFRVADLRFSALAFVCGGLSSYTSVGGANLGIARAARAYCRWTTVASMCRGFSGRRSSRSGSLRA